MDLSLRANGTFNAELREATELHRVRAVNTKHLIPAERERFAMSQNIDGADSLMLGWNGWDSICLPLHKHCYCSFRRLKMGRKAADGGRGRRWKRWRWRGGRSLSHTNSETTH